MIQNYIQELERIGRSENTIGAYETDLKQFTKWLTGTLGYETNDITPTDIRAYRQFLNVNKKMSVASVNRKLKSVTKFQNWLHETGISKNKVSLKDDELLQKNNIEQEHEVKTVAPNDLYKLKREIESSGNKMYLAMYYLLFGCGLRVSEMTELEIDDIYLTERNGKNNYSYLIVRRGKGEKTRKIPLSSNTVNTIKNYLDVRPTTESKKLLIGQRGAIKRHAVTKFLERFSQKALIDKVTPHMARHTAFTMMVKNGTDIKTIAQIAGHSTTDVTYKFYIASTIEDKINAIDNLNI